MIAIPARDFLHESSQLVIVLQSRSADRLVDSPTQTNGVLEPRSHQRSHPILLPQTLHKERSKHTRQTEHVSRAADGSPALPVVAVPSAQLRRETISRTNKVVCIIKERQTDRAAEVNQLITAQSAIQQKVLRL